MRNNWRKTLRRTTRRGNKTFPQDHATADDAEADHTAPTVTRKRDEGDNYFCDICIDTFELRCPIVEQQKQYVEMRHHQNLVSFRNAAEAGCWICERLWRRWRVHGLDDEADFPGIRAEIFPLGYREVCADFDRGWVPSRMRIRLETVRADDRIVYIPYGPFLQTYSDRTFAQAQRWIQNCRSNHQRCKPESSAAWHPTRLLDLQSSTGQVRLIETGVNPVADDDPYITLSHRWPPDFDSSLVLRDGTYQQFLDGVGLSRLPRLIQDAAAICSRFSIRYLWVDCMCIKQYQPKQEDWLTQSLSMENVYSRSYINLSAVASTNTHCSLFKSRLTRMGEGRLTTHLNLGDDGILRRGSRKASYRILDEMLWRREVVEAPLNKRAWVLQERLLATRTLHFSSDQLFWECRHQIAAEAYPDKLPGNIDHDSGFKKRLQSDTDSQVDHLSSEDQHKIWSPIVKYYSKCGLTKRSDKLVALSGLAKRAKRLFQNDDYVVGMWRSTLEIDLFWYSTDVHSALVQEKEANNPTRGVSYRAPSFSWASMDAEIGMRWYGENDQEILEVQDVQLNHVPKNNIFGAVEGGYLDLRCILQKVFLHERHDLKDGILRINGKDVMETLESKELKATDSLIYLDDCPKYFDPRGRDDLYCVPSGSSHISGFVHHLLLHPVDDEQGTFKRFGLASTRFYGEYEKKDIDRLLHNPPAEAANYPCRSYDAEKKRHIIRII